MSTDDPPDPATLSAAVFEPGEVIKPDSAEATVDRLGGFHLLRFLEHALILSIQRTLSPPLFNPFLLLKHCMKAIAMPSTRQHKSWPP